MADTAAATSLGNPGARRGGRVRRRVRRRYAGVRPVRLPASLVSLVPAGSPLDPAAAPA
ncbi:hypothetical protein [Micromonospora sp. NPDC047738]|uniref:hypothetical protein n=1 Tax=unclassified Micromonospora TaxID=2617518 RepID=UPI0033E5693A